MRAKPFYPSYLYRNHNLFKQLKININKKKLNVKKWKLLLSLCLVKCCKNRLGTITSCILTDLALILLS